MAAFQKLATVLLLWNAFVISAGAQGQLVFNNSSGTAIRDRSADQLFDAGPDYKVAIYALSGSGVPEGSLVLQVGAMTNLFAPGLFAGGIRTLGLPQGPATVQVRAWSGSAFTYEAALAAALGGDPSAIGGRSNPINITLTTQPTPPPSLVAAGFTSFTVATLAIPEPSTFALGLVGAMILVWTQRKLR